MTHDDGLLPIYETAIALTNQMGQAIASEDWSELNTLLERRASCLDQAQERLDSLGPLDRPDLALKLHQLQEADAGFLQVLTDKQGHVQQRLDRYLDSRTALRGYRDALVTGAIEPHFMDRDQ